MSYLNIFKIKCRGLENEFTKSITVLHISGLELKIKSSFFKNYQKLSFYNYNIWIYFYKPYSQQISF